MSIGYRRTLSQLHKDIENDVTLMSQPVGGIVKPGVLVAASLWWPLSARLASRLAQYGGRVSGICPKGHAMRHVPGLGPIYDYAALDSLGSLEAALDAAKPDFVVPCDDRVVEQLHQLCDLKPRFRALIESSLGPSSEYGIVSSRERFLQTAHGLGIRVPETRAVRSEEDIRRWFGAESSAAVLKRDGSWGGDGVVIASTEGDAVMAFRSLMRRPSTALALKRLLVNRDPLSLWEWRKGHQPAVSIQRFVPGNPVNAMMVCWRGELLGIVTVEVLSSQGATGAGIVVRIIENKEVRRAARLLAEHLSLTGFYGLDFMVDRATGLSYLIEMNPRCTQLGHLSLPKQGDLAGIFYAKISGRPLPEPQNPIRSDVIAFFPQALFRPPTGSVSDGLYLDVPWDHPGLIRELLLPSWPDRHWMARLYHAFKAPREIATKEFEPAGESVSSLSSAQG